MPILSNFNLPQFFQNKEMNHFYLAIALMTFAEALIELFVPIYLYNQGYLVQEIIFFYFLMSLGFVAFAYPGAKVVSKIGTKKAILYSTLFLIAYYLGLRAIEEKGWLFFLLPVLLSGRMVLYNYGYHLNYLCHSERKRRGREISFIGALSMMMYILAPLAGGAVAFYLGFTALYLMGAVILVVGTIPLFLTEDGHQELKFGLKELIKGIFSKKERKNTISFSGYAIEAIIGRVIWPIFLIMVLITVEKTGLIVTLSLGLSLAAFYAVGRITDKHDKMKLLKWGTGLYILGWLGRIFANSSLKILVVDSYKNLSEKIVQIPWGAKSYELAMKKDCFRFIVGREVVFNLSRLVVLPLLMLVFYLNFYPFLISFITAAVFSAGYMFLNKD